MAPMFDDVTVARFWSKVDKNGPDGCWLWLGQIRKTRQPYGSFWVPPKNVPAHRFSYELAIGPIPDGLVLDHLCRNPSCVNPAHLEPVTTKENLMRGVGLPALNAQKTHCKYGHPLSGDNLIIRVQTQGKSTSQVRVCKICKYAAVRKWKRQDKERRASI